MSVHTIVACTNPTQTGPSAVAVESSTSPPQTEPASAEKRVDPAESLLSPPTDLRQKLLRLILDREAQRKIQRSG